MQETSNKKDSIDFEDEIDLREVFQVLLEGKWLIISITSFVSIIGVIYSLLLPNIYESKTLLVPVNPSSGISGALGRYSALAGLAGINLPPDSDEGNYAKAIEKKIIVSLWSGKIKCGLTEMLNDWLFEKSSKSKPSLLTIEQSIKTTENIIYPKNTLLDE